MPSVTYTAYASAETDSAHTSEVTNNSFDVGAFSSQVNESFAYFDVSTLPAGAVIDRIVLTLKQKSGSYFSASVSLTVALCSTWKAPTSTSWSSKPAVSNIQGSLTFSGNETTTRQITLTPRKAITEYIFSGKIALKCFIPNASAGDRNAKGFYSASESDSSRRPSITIDYTEAGGAKVWNGSSWVTKPLKIWNGSSWVTKPLKIWNGSSWQ